MKTKELTIKERFDLQIVKQNQEIETYRKLVPLVMPIIEKFETHFKDVWIRFNCIEVGLFGYVIPPLFCECEKVGLSAIVENNRGMGPSITFSLR